MQKAERELIELNFKVVTEKLEEIHAQTTLTNDRLTKVEDQTKFFRWIEENPKTSIGLSVVLFFGFIGIGSFVGWDYILTKFI